MTDRQPGFGKCIAAEAVGTFILVFFGCGAVHVAVAFGDLQGLWQVGIVWGIAIMLAFYTVGQISGAHINPAITLGLAVWRLFPGERVLGYLGGQMLGAFLAAAALFTLFHAALGAKEQAKGVTRGELGSVITAMCYGEYFPNPGSLAAADGEFDADVFSELQSHVPLMVAIFAEILGTAVLGFVVVAVTDSGNLEQPGKLAPVFIGLTVAALICVIAPLTQACFNPARDFGPRIFAYLAGWRDVAIPGPNGYAIFVVYLLAPIAGAIGGIGLYQRVFLSADAR